MFGSWKTKYAALLDASRLDAVRGELALFFGPRADVYLGVFDKMLAKSGGRLPLTWSWSAFLLSFVWFFYRKMNAAGAAVLLIPIIIGVTFGGAGNAGFAAVLGVSSKTWYVTTGLGRIQEADKLGLAGDERVDYLRRAGGVSLPAGIISGLLYVAFLAAAIYSAVLDIQQLP